MKFQDFYKKFDEETVKVFNEFPKNQEIQNKIINSWAVHQTVEANKKLIRAT